MSRPTLAETQALFWKLITAPEGVAKGFEQLSSPQRERADSLVRDRPPLAAVERWDIYANMYFFRLRDCIQLDFAAVAGVVGGVAFHNLITDYLLAHPPSHFSLRYAGQHLPEFLDAHELSRQRPFLADLARLEYAIVDSFDAADTMPLRAEDLRGVPPQEWPGLRLTVAPAVRLLALSWPVADIWRDAKDGKDIAPIEATKTHMRVWRRDMRVFHKTIDGREAAALATLMSGGTFAQVCDAVATHDDDAEAALALLQTWLAEQVLRDLSP